jgi:hypothetical protein
MLSYLNILDEVFWEMAFPAPKWGVLEAVRPCFLFAVYYVLSLMVERRLLRVNYSRKAAHFNHILSSLMVNRVFLSYSVDFFVKSGLSSLLLTLLFIESIRVRSPRLERLFLCFDRPEDRPHTVRQVFTQLLAMNLVIIGMA